MNNEIVLGIRSALDPDLMISPLDRTFGDDPEIEEGFLKLRIGDRPFARNLRTMYELNDRKVPDEIEIFMAYDVWLITHVVSIMQEAGYKKVKQLGCEVRFQEEPKVTILELLPQTRFIKKLGGLFKSEAGIQLNGKATLPASVSQLLNSVENFSLGAEMTLSSQANIVGKLSFAVMSAAVVATGVGDRRSEWLFNKAGDRPLQGDQLMVHVLLTPKHLKNVTFKARIYATISGFNFIPVRLKSEWVDLACDLK